MPITIPTSVLNNVSMHLFHVYSILSFHVERFKTKCNDPLAKCPECNEIVEIFLR